MIISGACILLYAFLPSIRAMEIERPLEKSLQSFDSEVITLNCIPPPLRNLALNFFIKKARNEAARTFLTEKAFQSGESAGIFANIYPALLKQWGFEEQKKDQQKPDDVSKKEQPLCSPVPVFAQLLYERIYDDDLQNFYRITGDASKPGISQPMRDWGWLFLFVDKLVQEKICPGGLIELCALDLVKALRKNGGPIWKRLKHLPRFLRELSLLGTHHLRNEVGRIATLNIVKSHASHDMERLFRDHVSVGCRLEVCSTLIRFGIPPDEELKKIISELLASLSEKKSYRGDVLPRAICHSNDFYRQKTQHRIACIVALTCIEVLLDPYASAEARQSVEDLLCKALSQGYIAHINDPVEMLIELLITSCSFDTATHNGGQCYIAQEKRICLLECGYILDFRFTIEKIFNRLYAQATSVQEIDKAYVLEHGPDGVAALFASHAKVNMSLQIAEKPVLMHAIMQNFVNLVKILIAKPGINLNEPDKFGKTPLLYAAESNSISLCKMLIEAGANVEYCISRDLTVNREIHRLFVDAISKSPTTRKKRLTINGRSI